MTQVRVFINARGYDVAADASALEAVRTADPAAADEIVAGRRLITDSRGLPVESATPVYGGAIYRLIANRPRDPEATS